MKVGFEELLISVGIATIIIRIGWEWGSRRMEKSSFFIIEGRIVFIEMVGMDFIFIGFHLETFILKSSKDQLAFALYFFIINKINNCILNLPKLAMQFKCY